MVELSLISHNTGHGHEKRDNKNAQHQRDVEKNFTATDVIELAEKLLHDALYGNCLSPMIHVYQPLSKPNLT